MAWLTLSKIKKQTGASLIEILITVGIIGMAIITLYLIFIYSIKISQHAKHLSIAYQIANQEMETIRNTAFGDLINQSEGDFYSDSTASLAQLTDGQGILTIQNYEDDENIKEIIIRVNWTEKGTAQTVILNTLVTLGGINQ